MAEKLCQWRPTRISGQDNGLKAWRRSEYGFACLLCLYTANTYTAIISISAVHSLSFLLSIDRQPGNINRESDIHM